MLKPLGLRMQTMRKLDLGIEYLFHFIKNRMGACIERRVPNCNRLFLSDAGVHSSQAVRPPEHIRRSCQGAENRGCSTRGGRAQRKQKKRHFARGRTVNDDWFLRLLTGSSGSDVYPAKRSSGHCWRHRATCQRRTIASATGFHARGMHRPAVPVQHVVSSPAGIAVPPPVRMAAIFYPGGDYSSFFADRVHQCRG